VMQVIERKDLLRSEAAALLHLLLRSERRV
jgi:hypothetical protein